MKLEIGFQKSNISFQKSNFRYRISDRLDIKNKISDFFDMAMQ